MLPGSGEERKKRKTISTAVASVCVRDPNLGQHPGQPGSRAETGSGVHHGQPAKRCRTFCAKEGKIVLSQSSILKVGNGLLVELKLVKFAGYFFEFIKVSSCSFLLIIIMSF